MPQLSWHMAHWESRDKIKNISFSKSSSLVTVSRIDLMMHRSAKSWFHVMKNNHMSTRFSSRHLFMPGAFVLKTFTGNVYFYTPCSNAEPCQWRIQHAQSGTFWNTCCASKFLGCFQQLSCKKCKPGSRGPNPTHTARLVLRLFHLCEEHQDKRWIIISS